MRLRYDHGPDLNPTQHCYPIHSFIPPGWTCLCAVEADHLLSCSRHRGQPAACEGVFVCACPSIIISGSSSIVITIYFILFQSLTHSDHPSGWGSDRRCSVDRDPSTSTPFFLSISPLKSETVWL